MFNVFYVKNNVILLVKDTMIQGTSPSKFKESFMTGIWMFKNIEGWVIYFLNKNLLKAYDVPLSLLDCGTQLRIKPGPWPQGSYRPGRETDNRAVSTRWTPGDEGMHRCCEIPDWDCPAEKNYSFVMWNRNNFKTGIAFQMCKCPEVTHLTQDGLCEVHSWMLLINFFKGNHVALLTPCTFQNSMDSELQSLSSKDLRQRGQ